MTEGVITHWMQFQLDVSTFPKRPHLSVFLMRKWNDPTIYVYSSRHPLTYAILGVFGAHHPCFPSCGLIQDRGPPP